MKSFNGLKIGVIDSGIGGLSVLNALVKNFSNVSFIYYGDNHFAPYGNKPLEFIKSRLYYMIKILDKKGINGLVIACNTLSTHFYQEVKNYCPYFVIPTLPPIYKDKGTYLACTLNTAKSSYVKKFYGENVISFPCLAKTIEDNVFNLDNFSVTPYFEKLGFKIDRLVLGCTHYSYISKNINRQLNIETIDGYDRIISLLCSELDKYDLKLSGKQSINFIGKSKNLNEKVFKKVFCNESGYEIKKN